MEFTMSARTKLRDDFDADGMRSLARASKDAAQTRRLLALASMPETGKAAGLVLPRCTTAAMNAHPVEISQAVAPWAILDKAGWHTTAKLTMPANITLMPLPPRCPELIPVENIWQYLRQNWLSNRSSIATKTSSASAVKPGTSSSPSPKPSSIGLREWAHPS